MPQWRVAPRRGMGPTRSPEAVLQDARDIVDWCRLRNDDQLVTRPSSQDPDETSRKATWLKLDGVKRLVDQSNSNLYQEAFDLLDQAYPGRWRVRKRGKESDEARQRLQHFLCDVF